jgi:hypothetical protein
LIDLLYHPIHAILLSVQILIDCPFGLDVWKFLLKNGSIYRGQNKT